MIPPERHIRIARAADSKAVRELDDLAFGPNGQPADPGELEAGVEAGDIHVVIEGGVPVGFLHADASRAGRIYVAGVAVHPDRQERGMGSALIDHMLDVLGDERHLTPVVTVTAPTNVRMLRALFRRGFAARWFLADHFGPGSHRFGCQLLTATAPAGAEQRIRVPAAAIDQVAELMRSRTMMVCALIGVGTAKPEFELRPIRPNDFLSADPPHHGIDPSEQHLQEISRTLQKNVELPGNGMNR